MAYTTINKHSDYFNTLLYTGNGGTNAITGVGFQPDKVWIKDRTGTNNHEITDAVRGVNYQIYPNLTNAQTNAANHLTTFGTDGFTVGSDGATNTNSSNYVSWNWKAGNSAGSSNSDGSISSTVSVNTTAGFSIVKWTGSGANATVGHGLGVAPKMIMLKNTSEVYGWQVYHVSLGNTKYLSLNNTDAQATSSQSWNNTSPTSTVFSVGASDSNNKSGNTIIAYCFAEKTGYSKFGSYVGNGNTNGPYIYTGFKPSFVMVKEYANAGRRWVINDNKRDPFNQCTNGLLADGNDAETSGYNFDHLSNGFKPRTTGSGENASGFQYIYMAFGQSLVGSNNVPCTAR